jgi:hypothetical protein
MSFTKENAVQLVALAAAIDTFLEVAEPFHFQRRPLPRDTSAEAQAVWADVLNCSDWERVVAAGAEVARLGEKCGLSPKTSDLTSERLSGVGSGVLTLLQFHPDLLERLRVIRDAAEIVSRGPPYTLQEMGTCMLATRSSGLAHEQFLKSVPQRAALESAFRELFPYGSFYGHEPAEFFQGHLVHHGLAGEAEVGGLDLDKVVELLRPDRARKRATTKSRRSTEPGEARVKLFAGLIEHHQYAKGGCLNLEPVGNNELARRVGVSTSTAKSFFDNEFKGHTKYQVVCRDPRRLVESLKILNGDFSPHELYGRQPPAEDRRRDEE